jgi:hypothetical protein
MPFIIAGVVKSMALSFLGNSGVIEKVIVLLLRTLASKTDSQVDDKLVALLEKSLEKKS